MDKNLKMLIIVLAGVGGLVHLLAPIGVNILGMLSGLSPIVQFAAGLATLLLVVPMLMKRVE